MPHEYTYPINTHEIPFISMHITIPIQYHHESHETKLYLLMVCPLNTLFLLSYTLLEGLAQTAPRSPFVRSVCRHSLSGVFPRVFFGLATPSSSGRLESRFRVNRKTLSSLLHCLGTDSISGQPPLQFGFWTHG